MTDKQFLKRWKLWRAALNDPKDPHSLVQQVETLCWDVAVYEALMASWRSETAADGKLLEVNGVLFHFVIQNFIKNLCLGLRRLTEDQTLVEPKPVKNDRSVYSLLSLLADMRAHRKEYTRRRLFLACGLEYDVETLKKRHLQFVFSRQPLQAFGVPRELNPYPSEWTHQVWDRLCRRSPGNRSPDDQMVEDHFDCIESEVASMRDKVVYIVNKHFAHAATPASRKSVKGKKSVTARGLIELIVKSGRIVNTLSAMLSSAVFPFLATAQFDKWEYWSRGWNASDQTLEEAWDRWGKRVDRIEPIYPG